MCGQVCMEQRYVCTLHTWIRFMYCAYVCKQSVGHSRHAGTLVMSEKNQRNISAVVTHIRMARQHLFHEEQRHALPRLYESCDHMHVYHSFLSPEGSGIMSGSLSSHLPCHAACDISRACTTNAVAESSVLINYLNSIFLKQRQESHESVNHNMLR